MNEIQEYLFNDILYLHFYLLYNSQHKSVFILNENQRAN